MRIYRQTLRWRREHPRAVKAFNQSRRASKGDQKISAEQWLDICELYGFKCLCCGKQKVLHMDHVVSLRNGGRHTIENIQPLCRECNSRKGAKNTDYRGKS